MKAPSEKHLEDWIVANPDLVGSYADIHNEHFVCCITDIFGQQVELPSGRCDLLLGTHFWRPSITIAELKQGAIDSKSLAQCLRYMRDIQSILGELLVPRGQSSRLDTRLEPYTSDEISKALTDEQPLVTGLLIGSAVPDKNILVAAQACHIAIYTYQFDGESYSFDPLVEWMQSTSPMHYKLSQGWIGDAVEDIIVARCDIEVELKESNDGS